MGGTLALVGGERPEGDEAGEDEAAGGGSGAGSGTLFGEIERRNAITATRSSVLRMPANAILVPGILAFGSLMYSRKVSLFQVIPEFLLASE